MGGKRRISAKRPSASSRESQAQLAANAALTERIIEAFAGGIVHVRADGSIVRANAEALRILGMSFDEITNRYTVDFETQTIFEDGSPCMAKDYPVSRALMTGEPQRAVTIGVRRPDGEVSWAVFNAIPVRDPTSNVVTGAVVTFIDITQRRLAEQGLRESEATLRAVLTSAPSTIVKADLDGTIRYINRSVSTGESGEPTSPVIDTSVYDTVPADQVPLVRSCIDRVATTAQVDGYELERETADGRVIAESVTIGPVVHDDIVTGITMIATDITELRQLRTRLVVADRLVSVGTLAAGVAHEINNPLTYLMFKLNVLQKAARDGQLDKRLQADVDLASEGAERIRRIVEDLGTFSRANGDAVVPVDVTEVLELAIKMSAHEMRYTATLVRDYGEVPRVLANESRLGQVFVNLLINAIQSIPEGDVANNEVRITTRETNDGRVRIDVSDTGHGIPAELLNRVFEPFVTTKERGTGTGLGLHICHNIVQSMKGDLSVSTEVGKGTVFSVVLPATARPADVARRRVRHDAPSGSPLRILVVDDEAAIRDVFQALLTDHEVVVTSSGRQAIAELDNSRFDIVFCDLLMPDLTGIDVYRHLGDDQATAKNAIVFMTGGVFTNRAREFLDGVPNVVLKKPFDVDAIQHLITRAVAGRASSTAGKPPA